METETIILIITNIAVPIVVAIVTAFAQSKKYKKEKALLDAQHENKIKEIDALQVDYAAEVSDDLTRILGHKTRLVENRRSGKIEIEFYGADEREALIETLRKLAK